jgi:hypothetical protein
MAHLEVWCDDAPVINDIGLVFDGSVTTRAVLLIDLNEDLQKSPIREHGSRPTEYQRPEDY